MVQIASNTSPLTAQSDAIAFKAWTWAAARLNPMAYGDRMQHQHNGGVTVEHRRITKEMTLEEATAIYMDVIRQPLPGLPPPEPEPIEADYVDVTPSKT